MVIATKKASQGSGGLHMHGVSKHWPGGTSKFLTASSSPKVGSGACLLQLRGVGVQLDETVQVKPQVWRVLSGCYTLL